MYKTVAAPHSKANKTFFTVEISTISPSQTKSPQHTLKEEENHPLLTPPREPDKLAHFKIENRLETPR